MSIILPEGWTLEGGFIGYHAIHRDYDASCEGEEDGWVDNGLSVWAHTEAELPALIAELEEDHPHFAMLSSCGGDAA